MQYAKFPMKFVNVTQTPDNAFSHKGSVSAWDNAGKDVGIDDVFAPFDAEIEWKDAGKAETGIQITNLVDVLCADGVIRKPRTIHHVFWHDNDISELYVGKQLKQGEVFYQEGTAGNATGNHVHFNVGVGTYKSGTYPLVKNEFKVWEIKGEINPTRIFYITDDNIVKNTKGMKWLVWSEPVEEKVIRVGSVVKVIGTHYATGQRIPEWVKSKSYRVTKIEQDKALLGVISSWVKLKDLVNV